MNAYGLPPRISSKIEQVTESGCWIWMGTYTGGGYGQVRHNGRKARAHRAVYEILKGGIRDKLVLDHICRVRLCVNPAHLEEVAEAVNILRGDGIAAKNISKTHCIRGHQFSDDNILRNGNGRRCKVCDRKWRADRIRRAK